MADVVKIAIAGIKENFPRVVDYLTSHGYMHFEEYQGALEKGLNMEGAEDIADLLLKLQSFEQLLRGSFSGRVRSVKTLSFAKAKQEARELTADLENKITEVISRRRAIEKEILNIRENLKVLGRIHNDIDLSLLKSERVTMVAGQIPSREVEDLKGELQVRLVNVVIIDEEWKEGVSFVIIATERKKEEELKQILKKYSLVRVELPKATGKVGEIIDEMKIKLQSLEEELKEIDRKMADLSGKYYERVAQLKEMIENYYTVYEVGKKAGKSKYAFVLTGWVKKENLPRIRKELKKISNEIEIIKLPFKNSEAPAVVKKRKLTGPFYSIESLIGPPQEGEIDPLPTIALTFPFFFGMMLGDVGYGIILTLMAIFFEKQLNSLFKSLLGKAFSSFSKVLLISGITSTVFGFLFGELFGDLGHRYHILKPLLFDRLEGATPLLISAAIIGVIHLNIGILVGMLNEIKKNPKKALLGKGSWLLLQASLVLIKFTPYWWVLLLISIGLLGKYEGLEGLLEVPGFFSNVFSYTRLAAIGLSSAGIAMAVNSLTDISGGLGSVPGILVFLVGHLINIVLGIIDPFIQATRLHLVEFFTKFYEPAERVFNPLSLKKKYTGGELKW